MPDVIHVCVFTLGAFVCVLLLPNAAFWSPRVLGIDHGYWFDELFGIVSLFIVLLIIHCAFTRQHRLKQTSERFAATVGGLALVSLAMLIGLANDDAVVHLLQYDVMETIEQWQWPHIDELNRSQIMVLAFLGGTTAATIGSIRNRATRLGRPHCEECGQDLRGLSTNCCPECGAPFTANSLGVTEEQLQAPSD